MEKAVAMDTGNKEVRNGFGEVSASPQCSTVRRWMCELLSVDSAHSAVKGGGRKKMRGKSGRARGGRRREGGALIRVSAAPFFTADKNICLDINLEP